MENRVFLETLSEKKLCDMLDNWQYFSTSEQIFYSAYDIS